jgi:hypothetical protein
MRTLRRAAWACLLVLPFVVTGCNSMRFDVEVTNSRAEDLKVKLLGPGLILPPSQSVPVSANGGQAAFKVHVYKPWLPANFVWTAENAAATFTRTGTFIANEQTEGQTVPVNITP